MEHLQLLVELSESYLKPHDFRRGDLVTWKPGLQNRKWPAAGEPMVVIEVLDDPVYDSTDDSGSPYFREPLTVRCMLLDSDGDSVIFYYDARRLMPYGDGRNLTAN